MKMIISLFPGMVVTRSLVFIFFSYFWVLSCYGQDNLLKRKVNLNTSEAQLETVLLEISDQADFTFSYNASIFPASPSISVSARNASVRTTLDKILPEEIEYKVSGNHLILLKKLPEKKVEKYTVTGFIYNKLSKEPLRNIIIYEVSSLISAVTNEQGAFSLIVPANYEKPGLSLGNKAFRDTIIFIALEDQHLDVGLVPLQATLPAEKVSRFSVDDIAPIGSVTLGQHIKAAPPLDHLGKMELIKEKFAQGKLVVGVKNFASVLKGKDSVERRKAPQIISENGLLKQVLSDITAPFSPDQTFDTSLSVRKERLILWKDSLRNEKAKLLKGKEKIIESLAIVQKIVPPQSLTRTSNMDRIRENVAQVSFLPNLGTNLEMSGLVENKISLNVLAGYSYGVNVMEIGGLFNITRNEVNGLQASGLGNLVGGKTRGVQVAGLFNHNQAGLTGAQLAGISNVLLDTLKGLQVGGINNIVKGEMIGLQIAGLNNLIAKNSDGVQIAGLTNLGAKEVSAVQIAGLVNQSRSLTGFQLAGIANYVTKDVEGHQLAGLINKGKNVAGVQMGGILNIAADTLSGVQLSGLVNYAKVAKGLQMGFINIADSASGIPIGFLSIVKNGYQTAEIYTTEIGVVNIALKSGVKRFYNIFSAGAGSWKGDKRWMFGYGVGTERQLSQKWHLTLEYTGHWINEEDNLQEDFSLLNRLTFNITYRKLKGIAVSAGPTLNLWLSEWKDPETGEYLSKLAPYTIMDSKIGSALSQLWIGGKLAVHF